MNILLLMMNIKNIFFTTSISIVFGVYSLYKILNHIHRLDLKHKNQVHNLNIMLEHSYTRYDNIKNEYTKLKEEIVNLKDKIIVLEGQLNNSVNNDNNSLFISPLTSCDDLCELNNHNIAETVNAVELNIIDKINEIFLNQEDNNIRSEEHSYDNIETPPPSKSSSFCDTEPSISQRKRSISVNDVNWINLTKKFIFG